MTTPTTQNPQFSEVPDPEHQTPAPLSQPEEEQQGEPPTDTTEHSDDVELEAERSPEEKRAEWDALRRSRKSRLQNLLENASFAGATSFGGPAAGRDFNVNIGGVARTAVVAPVRAAELDELSKMYVPCERDGTALDILRETRVLVLGGAEDSGRQTTALHLLAAVTGGRVSRLASVDDLDRLDHDAEDGRCGYLVTPSLAETGRLHHVRLLSQITRLEESDSFLVVMVHQTIHLQGSELERHVVEHMPPKPNLVIRQHMEFRAPEHVEMVKEWLADPRLSELAEAAQRPRAVAELAAALAIEVKANATIDVACDRVRRASAAEATTLLRAADPKLRPVEQLHRRAFLIAMAIFDGAPYPRWPLRPTPWQGL